jgi:cell division protein FtsW
MREGTPEIARIGERGRFDLRLVLVTVALVALGLVMIASASQMVRLRGASGPHFYFFYRQLALAALGVGGMMILMKVPYRLYRRCSTIMLVASFALLVGVLVAGTRVRGSSRVLYIARFDIQPVEAAKIALVVFLASKVSEWGDRVRDFTKGFLPLAATGFGMAAVVALQPNISNAVLIVVITFMVLFVGGCRIRHLLWCGLGVLGASAPFLMRVSKVVTRIHSFLDGGEGGAASFQLRQSLIALGSGSLLGCGPGRGHQKYRFLPDAHTDFIYSIIGEELGLIGTMLVLLAFVFILRRAVRAARRAPDSFGYMLALGAGMLIFTSAVINIAMTTGVIPTAGLPLPFISYGGSSLMASLACIGIIASVSSEGREHKSPVEIFGLRRKARSLYARRK